MSQPHYYYYSIGGAEPPRSVCDGDHGACERTRMDVEARRGGAGTRRAHGTNNACGVQCSHLVLQPSGLFGPHILSQPTYRAPDPIGNNPGLVRHPPGLTEAARGLCSMFTEPFHAFTAALCVAGDDLTVTFFLLNRFR